ncbi:hypothetical protein OSB04_032065 [Centaurea solstitialis]|uniref:CCHC-type domain-containing protein n=1 Tax=Centaurea solstitialis TaxID=347529 RepID=A0AA38VV08_9ASTR|nr:hypothetical protein OSB04_032065 [Centaurea solstitialis]
MSNLAKLEFLALDITGKNYLSWVLDAEIHLDAKGLGKTIKEGNQESIQDRAKAMIFLRHHLHEALKTEYLTIKDPLILWKNLRDRYDHQRTVILPKARYEWVHLRFQDFKSVSEYNSAMFRITSQLTLCGEKITDEEMGFKKYCDLILCLLVAEQNNELLMKNHETRPTGTDPFPEANVATYNDGITSSKCVQLSLIYYCISNPYNVQRENNGRGRGHGKFRGRGQGRRRGRGRGSGRGGYPGVQFNNPKAHAHEKKNAYEKKEKPTSSTCNRCGMGNHWARTCRTARHLMELYQKSFKNGSKGAEVNFAYEHKDDDNPDGPEDHNNATHLDVGDFLANE